jgi:hypothetical protein
MPWQEDQRKREYESQNQPVLQHGQTTAVCIPRHRSRTSKCVLSPNRTYRRDPNDQNRRRQFFGP